MPNVLVIMRAMRGQPKRGLLRSWLGFLVRPARQAGPPGGGESLFYGLELVYDLVPDRLGTFGEPTLIAGHMFGG